MFGCYDTVTLCYIHVYMYINFSLYLLLLGQESPKALTPQGRSLRSGRTIPEPEDSISISSPLGNLREENDDDFQDGWESAR